MQLLESISNRLPDTATNYLLKSLQDIANNIQIQSNFRICHPNYKPLELPAEVVVRFQHLPIDLQHRYLNLRLRSFLYGIYYNGSLRAALAPQSETAAMASPLNNIENNTFLGIDLEFYNRLHQSNCGEGYFDPGWQVRRQENDGTLAVIKNGLTLYIQRDHHLKVLEQSAAIGNIVAIRMPKNLMEKGFYIAVGNAGLGDRTQTNSNSVTVGIYFHLIPEGAVAVMERLTRQLNEIRIPFIFKVLYNPADYRCYDSGVLYSEKSNYEAIWQVLKTVYAETKAHFHPNIPLFTKLLAPGLGLAEEPDRKFAAQESFGMNRCQIVANGLLEAWHSVDDSPKKRITCILQQFSHLGIDWQLSYLNAKSKDIYARLNL
ncbi:hypothetical protein C7B80_28100 [Cyanosarcina cf. burmensis CCALA 770]|nr:hypothetical protein C7B80_28100 [Cyanosarcina cf. burmensis CCALA 770]